MVMVLVVVDVPAGLVDDPAASAVSPHLGVLDTAALADRRMRDVASGTDRALAGSLDLP
ncbi:hypothetical protein [Kitasatospora sp. NE20-6]|uniref:hypothetical protein n=1 Tax=Kitasatospora sp. NE20-6 TaxID=2859066 RepID=UPI0038B2B42E